MVYSIDKRESKRIRCLRAICAIFIIYLHQYAGEISNTNFIISGTIPNSEIMQDIQYIVSRIITFCAVPLFFILSSVLLYSKGFTWLGNIKKKTKSLILPYILWVTVYIIIYLLGQTIPVTSGFFANAGRKVTDMTLIDYIGAYTGIGGHGLFVNALWFLRDLIILNLLASGIKCIIDRAPFFSIILLLMLWNFGSVPGILILSKQSIVFFSLGYYIVKYGIRIKTIDEKPLIAIIIPYVISIALEFYFYKTESLLRIPAHSFSVILGILLLIKISGIMIINETSNIPRVLDLTAEYSFFIYLVQDMIQTILKKISSRVFAQTDAIQMIEYLLIPILVLALATVFGMFFDRAMPRTYGLMTGSRKRI